MKFELPVRDVISSPDLMTKKVTLSANAKAFKIIFGQIYPDIIKAIVRELFTNAWDSQKVNGNLDKPIDIHLPTEWEPYFSIRDYGTGMTPQLIDEVYSRVFESSKDDSNEEAGMFGMGSKTPLGYTDSFAITSFVDGVYYAYDMYIDGAGEPIIALKATGETTEPNGVEVSVGVLRSDFDTFKNHAEIFAGNAGTPININRKRAVALYKDMITHPDWVITNAHHSAMIRMGCVVYAIDSSLITRNKDYEQRSRLNNILSMPLILDFDIGDFDVVGSREDIIYTDESIARIEARLEQVLNDVPSLIQARINKATCFGEAYSTFKEMNRILGSAKRYIADFEYKYKSWRLGAINAAPRWIHAQNLRLKDRICYNKFANYSQYGELILSSFRSAPLSIDLYSSWAKMIYVVIQREGTKNVVRRLRTFSNELTKAGRTKRDIQIIRIDAKVGESLARLRAIMPTNVMYVELEDVPPAPLDKRRATPKVANTSYRLNRRANDGGLVFTNRHEPIEQGSYYIVADKRQFDEDRVLRSMDVVGISPDDVHVIPSNKVQLADDNQLIDLYKHTDQISESIDYEDIIYRLAAVCYLSRHHGGMNGMHHFFTDNWHYIKPAMLHLVGADDIEQKISDFRQIATSFVPDVNSRVQDKFNKIIDTTKQKLAGILEAHPTIKFISSHDKAWRGKEILLSIGEME